MTNGLINYSDGFGDRIISTTQVPSQPNTVSGQAAQLYSFQQSTTFGQSLLTDLST